MENSADDLEFSAETLPGNAETIKFSHLEEPALQFVTIYGSSIAEISNEKHTVYSQ